MTKVLLGVFYYASGAQTAGSCSGRGSEEG